MKTMGALIFCASLLLVLVSQLRWCWRWPMTQSQSLSFSWLARQQGCPCAGGTPHIFAPHGWKVDQPQKLHACFKHPDMRVQDSGDIKNVLYTLRPRLLRVCYIILLLLTLTMGLRCVLCSVTIWSKELTLTLTLPTAGDNFAKLILDMRYIIL